MKYLTYEMLLDDKGKARYEELMDMLEERWDVSVEWELANEYFDIAVSTVTARILENHLPKNIWVWYRPFEDRFYVVGKGFEKCLKGFKTVKEVEDALNGSSELKKEAV